MDNPESLEDFVDLWDKACRDGIFKDAPKPPQVVSSFFDGEEEEEVVMDMDAELIAERAGDPYFDYMKYLLSEGEYKKTPNPIYPDSAGKDQDMPKAVWTDAKAFGEIEKMKKQLYDLECKLNTEEAGGKKWVEKCHHPKSEKMWSQIESMKKKIDEISNTLGQKEEPKQSLWAVKE